MRVASRVAWYFFQAINASLFLCLGLWILYQVSVITRSLLQRAADRQESIRPNTPVRKNNSKKSIFSSIMGSISISNNNTTKNDIFCSCLFGQICSPLQFIIYSTIFTTVLINVVLLCEIILNSLRVDHFLDYRDENGQVKKITNASKLVDSIAANLAFLCFCLVLLLLFIIHFERLSLTFKSTKYRLPKHSRKIEYGMVCLYTLGILMFAILIPFSKEASFTVGLLFSMIYLIINIYLIHGFYSRTISIANGLERDTPGLLSTTSRITICAIISLMTTVLNCFTYMLTLVWCQDCNGWILFRHLILVFDFVINAFCLLCSFREAEWMYLKVFGGIHQLFFDYLTQQKNDQSSRIYRGKSSSNKKKDVITQIKVSSITGFSDGNSSGNDSSDSGDRGSPVSLASIDFAAAKKSATQDSDVEVMTPAGRDRKSIGFHHGRISSTAISMDEPRRVHDPSNVTITEMPREEGI